MALINLGSIVSQGGKTTASGGLASGLDSAALIDGILAGRQAAADRQKDIVTVNTGKITALDGLYLRLDRFKTSLNLLRNEPGVGNAGNFLFNHRTTSVLSDSAVAGSAYLDVTALPGASVSSYTIENVTTAKAHTLALSGFRSNTASVVSGDTVAERYGFQSGGTIAGTALNTTTPVKFYQGYDGATATTQASLTVQFGNNQFDAEDTFTVGGTSVAFGTDVAVGASTEETLQNLANYLNGRTTGEESGYAYTVSGGDTLVITRNLPGNHASVDTNLAVSTDFSAGADATQTAKIGAGGVAQNGAQNGTVNSHGTDGSLFTQATDANTTFTSTLAGSLSGLTATFTAGSASGTTGFTSNSVQFSVTVGGQTYTSQSIPLGNGSLDINGNGSGDLGVGQSGFGNALKAGTEIIFTKDSDGDPTAGTTDVSFGLVVGADATVEDQAGADAFAASVSSFLSDNAIAITQDFDSTSASASDIVATSPAVGFRAGTFSLGGVDITLNEGDSLEEIKAKLNSVSETSGVQAEIIKVSATEYTLQLQSTKTGEANKIGEYGDGDAGDPVAGRLVFGGSAVAFSEIKAGSDASLTFNGVAITRETNEIDDIVENVTFSLKADVPGGTTLTADVKPDTEAVYDGVVDVLNNYNDLKFFISEQTQKDEAGNYTEEAVLGGDRLLTDVLQGVNAQITKTVSGISGALGNIFEVGIDLKDYPGDDELLPTEDIFTLDTAKLKSALASDFDAVRKVFAFEFTADSTELSVFSRTNEATLSDFKVDIDESRADGEKIKIFDKDDNFLFYADYEQTKDVFGNVIGGTGGTIVGKSGTSLAGLSMVYSGDGTDVITVKATQGAADRTFNLLDGLLDETTGSLARKVSDLQDTNERVNETVQKLTDRIALERDALVRRFSLLEAAIAKANNILTMFEAQRNVNNQ